MHWPFSTTTPSATRTARRSTRTSPLAASSPTRTTCPTAPVSTSASMPFWRGSRSSRRRGLGSSAPRSATASAGTNCPKKLRADRKSRLIPGEGMRLYFATDIHGSETCWRKFLNSGKHYGADVLILGGDMTGKALVPVVDDGGGCWRRTLLENRHDLAGEEEVAEFEAAVQRRGDYPFRTTPDELAEYESDPERADRFFHEQMLATVERWMALADERLQGTGIRAFVCPGNDDQLDIDPVIEAARHVE